MPRILLSFDVEEFDLPGEYGAVPDLPTQVAVGARGLEVVLDLLDRVQIPATFFTTAVFAQNRPDLLARMSAPHHELASHGWSHSSFTEADLLRSKNELERLSGREVRGFRRARFGAFDRSELRKAGYTYDSSENPIWLPGRYNHFGHPRTPWRMEDGLLILPVSASPILRYPLFWLSFKHSPPALFRAVSRWTLAQDGHLNLFFHPWEFTDLAGFGLPRLITKVDGAAMVARLETYLCWLKERAEFQTLGSFAAAANF